MEIEKTELNGVLILKPAVFGDDRGWFMESYNKNRFAEAGIDNEFVQDNQSMSGKKGTLRGIHFQKEPFVQAKIVRCLKGSILDVAVDLRKDSQTYKKWVAVELSAENKKQLFIPRGFGHALLTLEDDSEVLYKADNFYSKEADRSIRYDDPEIGIEWPKGEVILSEKDLNAPFLKDSDCEFKSS